MRVACLQMRSGTDVSANLASLQNMVGDAAARGATYIQTPEMSSLIDKNRTSLFAKIEPDDGTIDGNTFIKAVSQIAKQHQVFLHLGSIAVRSSEPKALNRGIIFAPNGTRLASYDKMHMFDVNLPNNESWHESATYQPGKTAVLLDAGKFTLGLSICYDLRFAELYRALAKARAMILTCPAAFTKQTGQLHWHVLLRSRAIENGAFMIAAAQGGTHESGRETFGHSLVVNPQGVIIGELAGDEPGILICDIDLEEVNTARTAIQNLKQDVDYQLTICKYAQKP